MAIVEFNYKEICMFMGACVPLPELRESLGNMGAPVESIDNETIRCNITPNRIDLLSVEGLARAMANFIGAKKPYIYEVQKSGVALKVDPSVNSVRPFIAAGIIRGAVIDDSTIKSLMQVQEKIHATYGRNRKKVAIGIHNLDPLKPPFTYKAIHPKEISFVPLDMSESLDLEQILEKHPKGKDYAHLVRDNERYPVILDANNNVLSFPPIINGELTRVSEKTTNIFIDVTGTSFESVNDALNVLCALFADRGGKIFSVDVGGNELPNLARGKIIVSPGQLNALIGFKLSPEEMAALLPKMGHNAIASENELEVHFPPYRSDILNWVDIAEDLAIAYGYEKFEPTLPELPSIGKLLNSNEALRETMAGLGFSETITFSLSNEEMNYSKMRLKSDGKASKMTNPLTADYTLFRTWLSPSLLHVLGNNSHEPMPQKIFEIGDCYSGGKREVHFACAIAKAKASFSEIKSVAEALAFEAGLKLEFRDEISPSLIFGRSVAVYLKGEKIGFLGEVHPEVLNNFGIEEPALLLEMKL
ncbi:MAG: phenylalanine--tRNA ligase subunit beta [Candidatus Micrarchaeota archaeon]